ncbi:MAG: amino acid adenylation domain-containing protein [Nostocales cyanobacterium]|nr:MAG: amino acid adenylation domain-containing protein [Nostocales cyanobacterium]
MSYLLHHLLETSAKNYPDVEAVIFKDSSITYQELDTRSHQLANTLREHGLEKGDRVGICLEPSIEEIVAIYGILKAGMVYVPMDAYTPMQRIAFMIENCGIKAIITAEKILTKLYTEEFINTAINHLQLAIIDNTENINQAQISPTKIINWQQVLTATTTSLKPVKLIDSDLAQILYTSGSTGKPKGVMISHRSSLNMANCFYECLQVQPQERISHQFSITFSASIIDIFTSIQAGATIVIVPPEMVAFPIMLAAFISEQKINIWSSVPSLLIQLILRGNLQQQNLSALRMITFAGEVFPIKYLRQLMEIIPHVQYCNNYGSTETGVRTYYLFNQIPSEMTSIPLGKAGHNIDLFLVNDENKIASPGEIGELYARGSSLMKGYWGMPEKTEEVLIPYTLNSHLGAEIVFRTGDLVKQDTDGNFVYVGRRDQTIKSRGYRIEIGEIEQIISQHPDIEEVAVIPIPDEQIGNRLKAVVVKKDNSEVTQNKLQYFCSQYLPKYMIPDQIEFRTQLPKTPRGKIDRVLLSESEKK